MMTTHIEDAEGRTGRLHISLVELVHQLDLPEGTKVRHVITGCDPIHLDIVVEHPDMDLVPPGAYSPLVGHYRRFVDDELVENRWSPGGGNCTTRERSAR